MIISYDTFFGDPDISNGEPSIVGTFLSFALMFFSTFEASSSNRFSIPQKELRKYRIQKFNDGARMP